MKSVERLICWNFPCRATIRIPVTKSYDRANLIKFARLTLKVCHTRKNVVLAVCVCAVLCRRGRGGGIPSRYLDCTRASYVCNMLLMTWNAQSTPCFGSVPLWRSNPRMMTMMVPGVILCETRSGAAKYLPCCSICRQTFRDARSIGP